MWQRRHRGFTLLELMVTIAVAAVLFTLAIPSYRSMVERNSMAAGMNDVVAGLNFARSQAVTRDKTICICGGAGNGQCSTSGDWQAGWIVYVQQDGACEMKPSPESTLRVDGGLGQNFRLQANSATPLSFNSSGFAMTGQTINAGRPGENSSQAICIAATGRVTVSESSASNCAPHD